MFSFPSLSCTNYCFSSLSAEPVEAVPSAWEAMAKTTANTFDYTNCRGWESNPIPFSPVILHSCYGKNLLSLFYPLKCKLFIFAATYQVVKTSFILPGDTNWHVLWNVSAVINVWRAGMQAVGHWVKFGTDLCRVLTLHLLLSGKNTGAAFSYEWAIICLCSVFHNQRDANYNILPWKLNEKMFLYSRS